VFLQPIQERDDGTTVKKVNGRELTIPSSSSNSRPNSLKFEAETPNGEEVRVVRADTVPIGAGKGGEG
jgi:hypothetical protein